MQQNNQTSRRWRINRRAAIGSIAVLGLVAAVVIGSYLRNRSGAADEFLARADAAAADGDRAAQTEWLQRYLTLRPDDDAIRTRWALSIDQSLWQSPPAERAARLDDARGVLIESLATLEDRRPELSTSLRRHLIRLLLHSGGHWFREAEHQLGLMPSSIDDPDMLEALAIAKTHGARFRDQRSAGDTAAAADPDRTEDSSGDRDPWQTMVHGSIADAMLAAVDIDPDDPDLMQTLVSSVRQFPHWYVEPDDEGRRRLMPAIESHLRRILSRLRSSGDCRSELILLAYGTKSDTPTDAAARRVVKAAGRAAERLVGFERPGGLERPGGPSHRGGTVIEEASTHEDGFEIDLAIGMKPSDWDRRLLAIAAGLVVDRRIAGQTSAIDDVSLDRWFTTLTSTNPEHDVSKDDLVRIYLQWGRLRLLQQQPQRAVELWIEANQRLGGEVLDLIGSAAMVATDQALSTVQANDRSHRPTDDGQTFSGASDGSSYFSDQRVDALVTKFESLLDRATDELRQSSGNQIGRIERQSMGRRIAAGRWRLDVARARRRVAKDDSMRSLWTAAEIIRQALRSDAEVKPDQRAAAVIQLARWQSQLDMPDLAAATLRRGLAEDPGNAPLQRLVAAERPAAMLVPIDEDLRTFLGEIQSELSDAPETAIDRLRTFAGNHPGSAGSALGWATEVASAASRPDLAIECLSEIPERQRTPRALVRLIRLCRSAERSDAVASKSTNQPINPQQIIERAMDDLRRLAGEDNVYLHMLDIQSGLRATLEGNTVDRSGLGKALEPLIDRIDGVLADRPALHDAMAIKADLLAAAGKPHAAARWYASALAAGDRRISTRSRYASQLVRDGQLRQAARVLQQTPPSIVQRIDPTATRRIDLNFRRGQWAAAVEMARQLAHANPDTAAHWVVLSQSAAIAAAHCEGQTETNYLTIGREAIESLESVASVDPAMVLSAKLHFAISLDDPKRVAAAGRMIDQSDLPTGPKLRLSAIADLAVQQFDSAIDKLRRSDEVRPLPENKQLLASIYRRVGRTAEQIELMGEMLARSPDSASLRRQLARTLATNGNDVDWAAIERLLRSADDFAGDPLLHATLLAARGNADQQLSAVAMLQTILDGGGEQADDAARVQIAVFEKLIRGEAGRSEASHDRYVDQMANRYRELTDRADPTAIDLHRYARFLLSGRQSDLDPADRDHRVQSIIDRLQSDALMGTLALDLIVARSSPQDVVDSVRRWSGEQISPALYDAATDPTTMAAMALLKLRHVDDGLSLLRSAYQQHPEVLADWVLTLLRYDRHDTAAEVAATHYLRHGDAASAVLLTEALLAGDDAAKVRPHRKTLQNAASKHGDNVALIEGVATLLMQSGHAKSSIALFEKVLAKQPDRIRSLNNLALARSESPQTIDQSFEPLRRAIALTDGNPELLDTKGVVLIRGGRYAEAEAVFRDAVAATPEPRFRFHLTLALILQGQTDAAREVWQSIAPRSLDPSGLTPAERKQWRGLQSGFETAAQEIVRVAKHTSRDMR